MRQPIDAAWSGVVRHAQIFLFADWEIDLDRIHLGNCGEYRGRSHQVAHLHSVDAGDAVDQRKNFRVAQIQRSLFNRSLSRFHGRLRSELLLRVGIELSLGNRVSFRLGDIAFDVEFGVGQLRLSLRQLPVGLIKRRLKWARIDFEENLALPDKSAFLVVLMNQISAHVRLDLSVDVPLERPHPFPLERYVFLDDWRYFDSGRCRGRRGSYPAFASGPKSRHEHKPYHANKLLREPSFSSDIQLLNNLLGVDFAGGKLSTISGHYAQEPFPALVDERDFV